ncbi:beta strand repeat-containing protein [Planctomicrobium piriforme]|uniref:beta strand repeat-containing protein n=1 Tax=Planctomicrobium piriforme TaxID=1576369 RepID=UPI001587DDF1|nr:pre-peptidase C-terminal domain-containing protein [Planctomicrobium piriforme]
MFESRALLSGQPIYVADFEGNGGAASSDGFTINNGAEGDPSNGLWHLSTGRGDQGGHSASHSMYYGKSEGSNGGGNISSYFSNAGAIDSPSILVPYEGATFSFSYLLQQEFADGPNTGSSAPVISISADGGNFEDVTPVLISDNTSGFHQASLDLAAYIGQSIQIRFAFSSSYAYNSEGWYVDDITVQGTDPDDQISEALPATVGSVSNGTINTGYDVDMHSFSAAAGQTLSFDIDTPIAGLNSYLILFDAAGNPIATSNDNAGPGESLGIDSFLTHTFADTGNYYIGVSGNANLGYDAVLGTGDIANGSQGDYTLSIHDASDLDDEITEATPVAVGSKVTGGITSGTDVDMYAITANAGQILSLDVDISVSSHLNSVLRLFDSSGAELSINDDGAAPGEVASFESYLLYTFPSSGIFYVGVSAQGNSAYDPLTGQDSGGGLTGNYTFSVFNAVPVISSFTATGTYKENAAPAILATTAIVKDQDSSNFDTGSLTVAITSNGESSDVLSILPGGTGAAAISIDNGNQIVVAGTTVIGTFTGGTNGTPLVVTLNANATAARTQALLRRIAFSNTSDSPSALPRTASVTLTDGDGQASQAVTKTINVTPVNDAPVLGGISGSGTYAENGSPFVLAPNGTVADIDSLDFNAGKLIVSITANKQSTDVLSLKTSASLAILNGNEIWLNGQQLGTFAGGTKSSALTITLNVNATPALAQTLLRNITFSTASDNPSTLTRTVQFKLTDGDGGTSLPQTTDVNLTLANDASVVTGFDGSVNYTGPSSVILDSDAKVIDADSPDLDTGKLTVSLTANAQGTDVLSIRNQGTGTNQIGVSGGNVTYGGVLIGTFTGGTNKVSLVITFNASATPAAAQALLRNIQFKSTISTPSTLPRTVRVLINDGDNGQSAPVTKTINFV